MDYFITDLYENGVRIAHPVEGFHYLTYENAHKYCTIGLLRGLINEHLVPCLSYNSTYNPDYYYRFGHLYSFSNYNYQKCVARDVCNDYSAYLLNKHFFLIGHLQDYWVVPYVCESKGFSVFDVSLISYNTSQVICHVQGIKQQEINLPIIFNEVYLCNTGGVVCIYQSDMAQINKLVSLHLGESVSGDRCALLFNIQIEKMLQRLNLVVNDGLLYLDDLKLEVKDADYGKTV